jgi:rhodanese-related sulfurtransferase
MQNAHLMTIKLIVDAKRRKVLGIQAVGKGVVAKHIDIVASVLTLGGTIDDLFDIDLSYAPPDNAPIDNVAVVANVVMNKMLGRFKGISAFDAKEMMNNNKFVFLDVRTPHEYKQVKVAKGGNIRHIPLGELRNRCNELNNDDEIVAFCKISLRGYQTEGILEGEQFTKVKVLEGGIFSWPFDTGK